MAARFPFEITILPRRQSAYYHDIHPDELLLLADALKVSLLKLSKALNAPQYNYIVNTAPARYTHPGYWGTIDHDFRWHIEILPRLTLIAGAFTITKPYYNLDAGLRYRQLGDLTHRGVEFSLTGQIVPGLSVVGGLLLLDPKIAGEAVSSGQIGPRPVGEVQRHGVFNLDWRLGGGKGAWSFDLALNSFSSRVGNSANTLFAAPRTTLNLGARYRFKLSKGTFLLRPLVQNLFDNYGWQVSTSGGWTYTPPRSLILQVVADF